jgi:hypothetical protein
MFRPTLSSTIFVLSCVFAGLTTFFLMIEAFDNLYIQMSFAIVNCTTIITVAAMITRQIDYWLALPTDSSSD